MNIHGKHSNIYYTHTQTHEFLLFFSLANLVFCFFWILHSYSYTLNLVIYEYLMVIELLHRSLTTISLLLFFFIFVSFSLSLLLYRAVSELHFVFSKRKHHLFSEFIFHLLFVQRKAYANNSKNKCSELKGMFRNDFKIKKRVP